MLTLEEVFKANGVPQHTFVRPNEYTRLLVALRTPGLGVVVEGPSGIGKTTAVMQALHELKLDSKKVSILSARRTNDVDLIADLPNIAAFGVVIIDDFHKLKDPIRAQIADLMKLLADEAAPDRKIVILGISNAGESLVSFANDLNNRIEVIPFEANPKESLMLVISLGEKALKLSINTADEIAEAATGSFYVTQMLCYEICLAADITSEQKNVREISVSFPMVKSRVMERLGRTFEKRTQVFAQGTRLRAEGRAPYLKLLYWLATSEVWTLRISKAIAEHPEMKGSISQIVDKGYVRDLIAKHDDIGGVLHFDQTAQQLSIEDPQYMFYLRNIEWKRFAADIGFKSIEFQSRYDFALSFAGSNRAVAQALFDELHEGEFEVFYDKNEEHRLLAADLEDYLRPIYQSDATFIVALLGKDYPQRVWTKFESEHFKKRFAENAVIPIWFTDAHGGWFDETHRVGGMELDISKPIEPQVQRVAELLTKKMGEHRTEADF